MSRKRKPDTTTAPAPGALLRAAVRLTAKDRTVVLAEVGDTCERVGVSSFPWLLEQELVRPLACTCPAGVPRQPAEDCPVDHETLLAGVAGATAALDAPKEA